MPQLGWDSAYDWQGFIPFESLPVVLNPDDGYIVTANNAIVTEDYPYALTRDWDYGWRAARIVDLLERKIAEDRLPSTTCGRSRPTTASRWGYRDWCRLRRSDGKVVVDAALDLLRSWMPDDPDSDAAAFANVLWDDPVQDLTVFEAAETPAPTIGQGRLFLVVDNLLADPRSTWWTNAELRSRVSGMLRTRHPPPTIAWSSSRATTRRSGIRARCTRSRS